VGDLGWGGVGLGSWGWAFSFLCFGIVECAHGHAYAKQVRIMCVLSVPLLDQVQGFFGPILEGKNALNTSVFDDFRKKRSKCPSAGGQKASVFDVFGLKYAISS